MEIYKYAKNATNGNQPFRVKIPGMSFSGVILSNGNIILPSEKKTKADGNVFYNNIVKAADYKKFKEAVMAAPEVTNDTKIGALGDITSADFKLVKRGEETANGSIPFGLLVDGFFINLWVNTSKAGDSAGTKFVSIPSYEREGSDGTTIRERRLSISNNSLTAILEAVVAAAPIVKETTTESTEATTEEPA